MLDIVEAVRFVVEHSGDNEGTFPGRSELVWFLLIYSKNQVSLLKCSTSHVSSVESTKVLLINGRPDQSHPSLFLQKIYDVLTCLLCLSF